MFYIKINGSLDEYCIRRVKRLFKDTNPQEIILFLWRNNSCAVIGRNQNPWKECNVRLLQKHDIPLIRRKSGGGTVFHDIGNTNYTLIMPRIDFTRKHTAELVVRALTTRLDIPAYVTERHDIAVNGLKISLIYLIMRRAYHHGTMLIDTDLDRIKRYLNVERQNLITKGVESFPSPVTNLCNYSSTVSHESFCEAVKDYFTEYYRDYVNHGSNKSATTVDEEFISNIPKVAEYREEFKTWEWVYGQTPDFTHKFEKEFEWSHVKALFESKNGIITAITLTPSNIKYHNLINALEDSFEGRKYGDEKDIDNALNDVRVSEQLSGSNIGGTSISTSEMQRVVNDIGKWIKESS
ncbi:putative lipoate--protein ligase [Rhizophagus irregularis DAOM 197198w]|uniref:Putative lipoate-protein ligase A n=1 Tax=Rhizophagus irregularis (strain DAOM 197198w) TaxID=1432141 RepID=A0A015KZU9_RHIIW|nr:putative lipoate--protein ligase [Rhizophagus irregularis DAOM 197198w]